ncbi:MAG: DUF2252 domain-containing protein [Actinobacteria bacterium]|nr:DUF2252 domain-containing protein [Actinomycetota bacterium]
MLATSESAVLACKTSAVATRSIPHTSAFREPVQPPAERRAAGKALREIAPRTSHAAWDPSMRTAEVLEVINRAERGRQKDLLPLRHARMVASPFAFLRGSALQMALDLAATPVAGPEVQLCGDAHISNFGVFGSPERRLVFDLNDFDETYPGPFEWDVKRLAASIAVAGRERGLDATATRRAVEDAVGEYRDWIDRYAGMTRLDLFYARLDTDDILAVLDPEMRRRTAEQLRRATSKNHLKALDKLTAVVDGKRRIVPDPPIVTPFGGPALFSRLEVVLDGYLDSLSAERRHLFEQYRFVDFARKVVGVGSVGTRCFMVLLQGPNGGPLFLQLKEAVQPSPAIALGHPFDGHQGRRVVEGQRQLQAVSDVLLGWGSDDRAGRDFFLRQLWDAKGSFEIAEMRPAGFRAYTRACAWALARAHARTGHPVVMAGYLGTGDTFPRAIAEFAEAYADQTERDHAVMVAAINSGKLATV